ncbi:MAG: flavodoxin [Ilumatobacteraceae bacterium]
MKALVVFESMFGNTRHIAEAIADGLRMSIPTEVVLAGDAGATELGDVQLVVVGGPTHAWGLVGKRSRAGVVADVAKHPDHILEAAASDSGVREWLKEVKRSVACRAVAFDTRFDKPMILTGSAARVIQRRLGGVGFSRFDKPHSFKVTGMAGPLAPGEVERARQWGEAMGRTLRVATAPMTMEKSAR